MNTNKIINKCIEIPGVSLKKNPSNIELCMQQDNGKGSMTFFSIFPGISIAYIFINSPTWPIPDLSEQDDFLNTPLLLNYCVTGRCELFLDNDSFVYLKDGEFSISKKSAQKQYTYPLRIYEGLELFIDIDTISTLAPYINDVFNININKITDLYCLLDKTYISQCSENIKHILAKIWELYDEDTAHAIFMMKIYTLQLLEMLLCSKHIPQRKSLTFFTATQVKIAQKTERIITADLKQHHPAYELAKLFSISETSLKNYFRGIYGQNISVYLREARMNEASKMLEKTKMPISKISEQVGYMNQSKFASVFKLQYNMSPLEYRRKKVIEEI
ncbi:helix-turn-helix domain-containing protein [Clostridium estertheticum]|uniref:helix-turn-helix domain-containing protein n=1 Tax=Clostridium estertheticum TaxID=238834 RepID=UPI001C0C5396|nr:helix-turn-helix domain-containing protein [Clostridium estertheticum]MBU3184297.1 AraC family transcriptional regulator [Clostridium estertheticum]